MLARKTTVSFRTSEQTPQQYTGAEKHKDSILLRENGPHRGTETTLVYENGLHREAKTTVIPHEKGSMEKWDDNAHR